MIYSSAIVLNQTLAANNFTDSDLDFIPETIVTFNLRRNKWNTNCPLCLMPRMRLRRT